MAQNTTITVTPGSWQQLTDADATNVTFQNVSNQPVQLVRGGTSAPSTFNGSLIYDPGYGEINRALADIWPGGTGSRLWAYATDQLAMVAISHA